jgi:hypothetical protein
MEKFLGIGCYHQGSFTLPTLKFLLRNQTTLITKLKMIMVINNKTITLNRIITTTRITSETIINHWTKVIKNKVLSRKIIIKFYFPTDPLLMKKEFK